MTLPDHERLAQLVWPCPAMAETARRRAAWVDHFFPEARRQIEALVAAGEYHPDIDGEATALARMMAIGPTKRGEWPDALLTVDGIEAEIGRRMDGRVPSEPRATSLRSPEPVPVSALPGNARSRKRRVA